MVSVLTIRSLSPDRIYLEEISAPIKQISPYPPSWIEWVKKRAPGHTSWVLLAFDLRSGEVTDCYSFSKHSHVAVSSKESLLATLLKVPLTEVSLQERKKIGPPPEKGEMDIRKIWTPPFTFEGKKIGKGECSAFQTKWPQDGTEWGGYQITFYFDQEKRTMLPIWIEIEGSHGAIHFREIDAGTNLLSPMRYQEK